MSLIRTTTIQYADSTIEVGTHGCDDGEVTTTLCHFQLSQLHTEDDLRPQCSRAKMLSASLRSLPCHPVTHRSRFYEMAAEVLSGR